MVESAAEKLKRLLNANWGEAEFDIQMLECLLHYHERVTMPVGQNLCKEMGTEKCPERLATDQYAETLREAIRCIRIVHGL